MKRGLIQKWYLYPIFLISFFAKENLKLNFVGGNYEVAERVAIYITLLSMPTTTVHECMNLQVRSPNRGFHRRMLLIYDHPIL